MGSSEFFPRNDTAALRPFLVNTGQLADHVRPVRNQRSGNAAFMHPVFVKAEGRVAHVGPSDPIALEGVFRSWHYPGVVTQTDGPAISRQLGNKENLPRRVYVFGTTPIVG